MARRRILHSFPPTDPAGFLYALVYSGLCYAAVHALAASVYGDPTVSRSHPLAYLFFFLGFSLPVLLAWRIQRTWPELPLWATIMAIGFYAVGFFFILLPAFLPLA